MNPNLQLEEVLQAHNGPAFIVDGLSRRIIAANRATERAYGYPVDQLTGLPIEALWPAAPHALDGRPSGSLRVARHRRRDGQPVDMNVTVLDGVSQPSAVGFAAHAVNDRAFSLALIETQSRVLERMAAGATLDAVLHSLVVTIEELSGDMLGSVLLLSPDGRHVVHGAAPHLPRAYWNAIDGLEIGPAAGSCGTAMYSGRQVIVVDVNHDDRWRAYKSLALEHGLRACWSTPIVAPPGEVLGAFALYYREPREPGEHEQQLVQVAAELAAIAIERDRAAALPQTAAVHPKLSARELEIVRLIAQGAPVKRIAADLGVSISTVYTHRARIFEKLGVDSNVAVARYAVTRRLIH
jgi:DNA-binding CsgD family transcriptional regulator